MSLHLCAAAGVAHLDAPKPATTRAAPLRLQLLNFAVFQAAWTAAVLGAAGGWPMLGVAAIAAALAARARRWDGLCPLAPEAPNENPCPCP